MSGDQTLYTITKLYKNMFEAACKKHNTSCPREGWKRDYTDNDCDVDRGGDVTCECQPYKTGTINLCWEKYFKQICGWKK